MEPQSHELLSAFSHLRRSFRCARRPGWQKHHLAILSEKPFLPFPMMGLSQMISAVL